MARPSNGLVLDRVRQAVTTAIDAGQSRPGRPRLVATIPGATEHQVRKALEVLAKVSPPPHHQNSTPLATPQPGGTDATTQSPAAEPSGDTPDPPPPATDTGASQETRHPRPWPLGLIGLAAAVAVWGGWVDLGRLTGFGMVQPLPGLVDSLWINTAIVLPLGIEAYGGYALRTWLSSATLSTQTRKYARWSALASLVVGAGAQVASHLMGAAAVTTAPWYVTVLVACVPVAVLGLATGLATLVRQDTTT